MNGNNINTWLEFVKIVKNNPNQEILLTIKRNSSKIELPLMPKIKDGVAKVGVSVFVPKNYLEKWQVTVKRTL